ncbi:MAG: TatD family hydrolase [Nanoarchaeota archaeon]|nr:TatD family hydrolase [Nanoarchaeota archaeon]
MNKSFSACFIDAHCHLDLYDQAEIKVEDVIKNAQSAGVNIILANGVNPESNRKVLSLAKSHSEIKACLGLYPIDALRYKDQQIDEEIKFIEKNKDLIVAIGEVGMDFKEDIDNRSRQKEIFIKTARLAMRINKPLIIHSRKAEREIIEILEELQAKKVIMHCFSGKFSLVKRIADNGWTATIPTSVKSSEHFQKIIAEIPLEKLLCETDSPYLHPDKKWPNQPSNVIESYKKIAEIKKLPLEEVKEKIFNNYKNLSS